LPAIDASRDAAADAATDEKWGWYAGNDEDFDARSRRGPIGYGRDAEYVGLLCFMMFHCLHTRHLQG